MVTAVNTKVLYARRSRPPHHPDKRYRRSIPGGILASSTGRGSAVLLWLLDMMLVGFRVKRGVSIGV